MKVNYEVKMNRKEFNEVKSLMKQVEAALGDGGAPITEALGIHMRMTMSSSLMNVFAFMKLKDEYEVTLEVEIGEEFITEYCRFVGNIVPHVAGLVTALKMGSDRFESIMDSGIGDAETNIEFLDDDGNVIVEEEEKEKPSSDEKTTEEVVN